LLQDIAALTSEIVASVTQRPINLGATQTGIPILLVFIAFHISIFFADSKRRFVLLSVHLIALVLITLLYVILQCYLSSWLRFLSHKFSFQLINYHMLIFFLFLPTTLLYYRRTARRVIPLDNSPIIKRRLLAQHKKELKEKSYNMARF
jgi:hypothetical protein